MTAAPGLAARRGAAALLTQVTDDRRTLAEAGGALHHLPPADRARAQRAATETLRHLSALDAVLAGFLKKPPPGAVMAILRLAAWEILVDGVPAYAAVDGAVRQARKLGPHRRLAPLVNAVGRRLGAVEGFQPEPPALPAWLAKPVERAFGAEAAAAIAAAHGHAPPLDLTPKAPGDAALASALGAEVLPTGSLRRAAGAQVSALPGYAEGRWWVQDAAAAMPVRLLGDLAGRRVVDLCAAPGGKTLQLAAAGAEVIAVDVDDRRLARVRENLQRTGLKAHVVAADALDWAPEGPVDAVVLDAPCSASGTLRRHPDLPFARPDPDLASLIDLQAALIDRALGWLGPGGRLLYCTCSLLPAEGEDQAKAALARHPGLRIGRDRPGWADPEWWSEAGFLRLRPDYWAHRGGMDGFFAAVFQSA